ncbi:MAG TPA: ABC transporter permease subunit, partial [Candidatus Acidoferrales bacterium]|nr:ABC transporter permease subunit [Candidatus Acidoferrales bacterium]
MTKNNSQLGFFKKRSIPELTIRLTPILILIVNLASNLILPNKQVLSITYSYAAFLIAAIVVYAIIFALSLINNGIWSSLKDKAILLSAAFLVLTVWDLVTLKSALLRLPYFPGPDKVLSVFASDWQSLVNSAANSLVLLIAGFSIGTIAGLVTGVLMGWYQRCNFWIGPLLKIIGPIPATAWLPIAMVAFPTSFLASVFLIAVAVWFPVSVMTSSGIANVGKSYFEVAKTLGGDERYLILKVAVPAALPMIFIGL